MKYTVFEIFIPRILEYSESERLKKLHLEDSVGNWICNYPSNIIVWSICITENSYIYLFLLVFSWTVAERHQNIDCITNISKLPYKKFFTILCLFCAMLFVVVTLQILRLFTGVVAVLTSKGLFVSVWKHVLLQVSSICARIVALLATERLLSRMR